MTRLTKEKVESSEKGRPKESKTTIISIKIFSQS